MARILALPLLVVGLTGWIPDKDFEVGPKGPWPWGAIVGLAFIGVALVGLLVTRAPSVPKKPLNNHAPTPRLRRAATSQEFPS
jgi:hypothetical protein